MSFSGDLCTAGIWDFRFGGFGDACHRTVACWSDFYFPDELLSMGTIHQWIRANGFWGNRFSGSWFSTSQSVG